MSENCVTLLLLSLFYFEVLWSKQMYLTAFVLSSPPDFPHLHDIFTTKMCSAMAIDAQKEVPHNRINKRSTACTECFHLFLFFPCWVNFRMIIEEKWLDCHCLDLQKHVVNTKCDTRLIVKGNMERSGGTRMVEVYFPEKKPIIFLDPSFKTKGEREGGIGSLIL